ncbi:MAG: hypothetical protein HC893_04400 [Chloroflexaceae bacterium]|nr:hypothetical protein [Chloroflexaceae bacterium]
MAEHGRDEGHIWRVAEQVADKIERSGREVIKIDVPTPSSIRQRILFVRSPLFWLRLACSRCCSVAS